LELYLAENIGHDILLGVDNMRKLNIKLDLEKNTIEILNLKTSLSDKKTLRDVEILYNES
jgi:hypothetical protein